jgi:hypothetical protein
LQLIEIVQLALLIFIALSATVIIISYMGYRTKSNVKEFYKTKIDDSKKVILETPVSEEFIENPETHTSKKSEKQKPRFEIFNPSSDDKLKLISENSVKKKSHSPKTLIIKHKS